jgi:hypothetical protein
MVKISGFDWARENFHIRIRPKCITLNKNLSFLQSTGYKSDEFESEGLHDKHEVATWRLGNILSFAWRHEENKNTRAVMDDSRIFWIHAKFLPAFFMAWLP